MAVAEAATTTRYLQLVDDCTKVENVQVAEATPTTRYLQHRCSARTVQVMRRYKSSSCEVCPCHDEGDGQPEAMRGVVHLAPGAAAFDASGERGGIDLDTLHA
jgi:hypothetical protein